MNKNIEKIKKNPTYVNKLDTKKIVKILKYASDIYYSTNEPIFSDKIYDIILDILYKKDPNNKYLKIIGSSLNKINKVKLPFYMPSLDKIKLNNKWIQTYKGPYHISDKLDGVSGLLHYKNNKINLYTRGDGSNGMDISFLLDDIKGIKKTKDISIRGELILEKKDVSKDMKNGRNTVSGIVNSKKSNYNKNIAKKIKFVAYEILHPKYKVSEQFNILKKLDFYTPFNKLVKKISIDYLNKLLLERRNKSLFDIDGLVVKDNKNHIVVKGENPKYAFAYKINDKIKQTKVIDIIWDISKDKILVPVILFEKIQLGGVDIQKTTGFNAKFVKDNLINKGSVINIVRSGEVIPYINNIITKSKDWLKPNINYKWSETNVNIVAVFDNKKDSKIYQQKYEIVLIKNFFSVLKAPNISIGIITKLYNNKYNTIKKILNMKITDFLKINGIKDKMANKLYNSIQTSMKNVNLSTLMVATNIFGKGWNIKKFDLLLKKIPFNKLIKLNKNQMFEQINSIKGFSDKSSKRFVDRITLFIKFLDNHKKIYF